MRGSGREFSGLRIELSVSGAAGDGFIEPAGCGVDVFNGADGINFYRKQRGAAGHSIESSEYYSETQAECSGGRIVGYAYLGECSNILASDLHTGAIVLECVAE